MGLQLQGGSANIADIQFEGGSGNKTVIIPKEGGKLATVDSPTFAGTPIAPTQTAQDNSTKVATTAYVDGKMVRATAVTASGTSIDFTGIPSWAKRITVMFNGVSTNGISQKIVQLGSTTFKTTSYSSGHGYLGTGTTCYNTTTGFGFGAPSHGDIAYVQMIISLIDTNSYLSTHSGGFSPTPYAVSGGGSVTLSGVLDIIRITTVNGTDTFDAGSINIMYEG